MLSVADCGIVSAGTYSQVNSKEKIMAMKKPVKKAAPSSFGGSAGKKLTQAEGKAMAKGNVFRADAYGRKSFGTDAKGSSQGASIANYPGRLSVAAKKQIQLDKDIRKKNPSQSSAKAGMTAPKKKTSLKGKKY
jgi:hypothetical protein